ncbi:(2Fe-2S)-binding protein [Pseudonocardia hispaniensis]|uniref:(2Fe-2S)-binding protein n=1 Tax=Pseudonocardia hispaniensis TaxID=904933 RepID=A0ABW1J218_9PSEU
MTIQVCTALAETAARVSAAVEGLDIRFGSADVPAEPAWTRCSAVDADFLADWERAAAADLLRRYGATHPTTAAAYVLHWYAKIPGAVGAALFRHARRIPRLDRDALAFHRAPDDPAPSGAALLDERFWCLPDDPAAEDPAATVVPDETTLAAVLRSQVRIHADAFLADYGPGVPLPRRARLGAFFDGLDTGIWRAADGGTRCADPAAATMVLGDAALVLPGGTPEFPDASTLHLLHDNRARPWLSRRRVSCCFYFKVSPDGSACTTCPRTPAAERAQRYAELTDFR